jgi:hypothetical protein
MNKKIICYTTSIIILIIAVTAFIFLSSNYSILRIDDIATMIENNKKPAITIPDRNEEYFNKWQCFDVKNIDITYGEIDIYGKRLVPYIQVNSKKQSLQFNVDPSIHWNKDTVIKNWKELIENIKSICFLAAYLQTDPDSTTVWYIKRLKTKNGYWDISDYSKYIDSE